MRTRELLEVADPAGLQSLAGKLACSKLYNWFNNLPESSHITPCEVVLPGTRRSGSYNVRMLYTRMPRSSLSLFFRPERLQAEQVTFTSREKLLRDEGKLQDVDLLSNANLAWRRAGFGRLELIPSGQYHRHNYEPTLISVEAARALTPLVAEQAVAQVATLLDL